MSLPILLELVEIRTKLASVLPFAIGTLFAVTYFHAFDWLNTLLFFTAMLIFDMMTTALNNLNGCQVDSGNACGCFVAGRCVGRADGLAVAVNGDGLFCHWYFVYLGAITAFSFAAW